MYGSMKKNIFAVLLLVLGIGMSFAQEQPAPAQEQPAPAQESPRTRQNSLAIDLFTLVKGFIASDNSNDLSFFCIAASYERLVAPHFSFGANADLYFASYDRTDGNYFSLSAEGRLYPQSENFEKFFLGAALGFNTMSVDGKSKPEYGGFTGLIVLIKAGYKYITSNNIYMEPSISYVLSKTPTSVSMPSPLGLQGGFRFGFVF